MPHKGGYYFYRLHEQKLRQLCNGYSGLHSYLNDVFIKRPDEYFNSGPRSSALKFKLPVEPTCVTGHETSMLARHGLHEYCERFKTAHSQVQVFMLENDNKTIAMEVPIWLHPHELPQFTNLFGTSEPLSGHIDVLRVEDNKIWIWDYKPHAQREKYASTQVYFYAVMLSARTGIDLEHFRCGYFDHDYAYLFKPERDFAVFNQALVNYS